VFAIGSLTGDSLVRFAMGGCVHAAGRIEGGYFGDRDARRKGVGERTAGTAYGRENVVMNGNGHANLDGDVDRMDTGEQTTLEDRAISASRAEVNGYPISA
jgi:hypothetical protein